MIFKISFIFLLVFVAIFTHYSNQHMILSYSRQIDEIATKVKSAKDLNLSLLTQNSTLGSRERIQKLAYEKLNMVYPNNQEKVHSIVLDKQSDTFCLVDFIVPSAEALTRK